METAIVTPGPAPPLKEFRLFGGKYLSFVMRKISLRDGENTLDLPGKKGVNHDLGRYQKSVLGTVHYIWEGGGDFARPTCQLFMHFIIFSCQK